jgi:hypothetical protein
VLTVACVLRSGPSKIGFRYQPRHVTRLADLVDRFLPARHRFVCLTDMDDVGVEMVPLRHSWPGWWSKLELFQHDFGPTIYFDLDVAIQGDLSFLVPFSETPETICAMEDSLPDHQRQPRLGSAVMAWSGSRPQVCDSFSPAAIPEWENRRNNRRWGDQSYLQDQFPSWVNISRAFPGRMVSHGFDPPEAHGGAAIVNHPHNAKRLILD